MSSNRNYRIMKFFEATDKSCTGKGCVKIDLRGNRGFITVTVENLGDGKTPGEVYLFKNRNDKIKIGPINSKRGRLQRSITLNNKDEPIENYNICGIVIGDKVHMYTPVFTPIKTTQVDSLLKYQEIESINEPVEEEDIFEEHNEIIDEIIDEIPEPTPIEEEYIPEDIDNQFNKISYEEYQKELNKEESNVKTDVESQEAKTYTTEYERNLYKLLDRFEPIKPLAHDIRSIKWWKVLYDENSLYKGFLPYFNQIITTYYPYPMANHITSCQTLLRAHGYYLFGIYEKDGKVSKFVYGLPGKFTRDQQPYKGVTGFKNWSYKNNDIPGDYGYWLAFIDSDTGAICDAPEVEA